VFREFPCWILPGDQFLLLPMPEQAPKNQPPDVTQRYPDSSISFTGKISPNFDLKNMISIHAKDFSWKKWPKFTRF
jgi:hypothetical protein